MNDLISRQGAIDNLNFGAEFLRRVLDETDIVGADREKFAWGLDLIESCISDMKDLPPAQLERKKGKWNHGYCSECGYYWGKDAPIANVPNYCPNCAADMRGEQDG